MKYTNGPSVRANLSWIIAKVRTEREERQEAP